MAQLPAFTDPCVNEPFVSFYIVILVYMLTDKIYIYFSRLNISDLTGICPPSLIQVGMQSSLYSLFSYAQLSACHCPYLYPAFCVYDCKSVCLEMEPAPPPFLPSYSLLQHPTHIFQREERESTACSANEGGQCGCQ